MIPSSSSSSAAASGKKSAPSPLERNQLHRSRAGSSRLRWPASLLPFSRPRLPVAIAAAPGCHPPFAAAPARPRCRSVHYKVQAPSLLLPPFFCPLLSPPSSSLVCSSHPYLLSFFSQHQPQQPRRRHPDSIALHARTKQNNDLSITCLLLA
uniref:Predicted protein n=1 Tax=Hordeum vulgare subsp. vulgare TaxID=112509 RepID=F2DKQ9_HORVV|nr:predicted protein [Hordeum vulgare subsp. vulgare]